MAGPNAPRAATYVLRLAAASRMASSKLRMASSKPRIAAVEVLAKRRRQAVRDQCRRALARVLRKGACGAEERLFGTRVRPREPVAEARRGERERQRRAASALFRCVQRARSWYLGLGARSVPGPQSLVHGRARTRDQRPGTDKERRTKHQVLTATPKSKRL
jgi:hypothetical protein